MDLTQVKHEIETLAEKHRDEFEVVSAYIFAHPELAYHETLAQDQLCGLLEKHGFKVQRGAGSLETAFVAEYRSGKPGMTFAFMCEYDALPEIGHACGHNLIGTSGAGAGVILKEIMEKYGIGGTLKVLGTPAEENGSGKITMLDEGIFDGVDMALIMHPSDMSMADDISFAAVNKTYTFTGKPAHTAACPWMGASALNGVLQMFHAVDSQRLHFKDYTRVHGIILEGGTVVNIVPERAVCKFNIRALDAEYRCRCGNSAEWLPDKRCPQQQGTCDSSGKEHGFHWRTSYPSRSDSGNRFHGCGKCDSGTSGCPVLYRCGRRLGNPYSSICGRCRR